MGCSNLRNIVIPNSVTKIGNYAFSGVKASDIYCYLNEPIVISKETFSDYSATLHVPKGSLDAYKSFYVWSNFFNIIDDLSIDGESGIENVSIKDYTVKNITGGIEVNCPVSTKVHVINLNGTTVCETIGAGYIDLPIGFYIVTFDGTSIVKKIMVK